MNKAKRDRILADQTHQAQKVYSAVPIEAAWDVGQIHFTLANQGVNMAPNVVGGCCTALYEAGLIRIIGGNGHRRLYSRAPVTDNTFTPQLQEYAVTTKLPKAEPTKIVAESGKPPAASSEEAINQLVQDAENIGEQMLLFADRLRDLRKTIEADKKLNDEARIKLDTLRDLYM